MRRIEIFIALLVALWLFFESYLACVIFICGFAAGAILAGTLSRGTPVEDESQVLRMYAQ